MSPRWLVVLAVLTTGCFGNSRYNSVSAQANANTSSKEGIVKTAADPRTNDPTAAGPLPLGPTPGASASLSTPDPSFAPTASSAATDPNGAKKPPKEAPSRIGARHVLVQWMGSERAPAAVVRSKDQALIVAQDVLRRAKAGDDFVRLAVEFSDEPSAAARGGSLGRFGHGQMVGAFEAAAFKLEVGQISDIVESPFGFHIIQRTE